MSINFTPARVFALLLIPVLLYFALIAGSRGLADFYARSAMSMLYKWERGQLTLTQDDWQMAQDSLSRALKLDPSSPRLHLNMGLALEGPYRSYFTDQDEGNIARQKAADHYRTALRLQPLWPYAWSDLANVKFRSVEIDDEFYQAVDMAIELGPWETGIQAAMIRIGMVLWHELNEQNRPSIQTAMVNGLQHNNRSHALNTLRQLHRTGVLTGIAHYEPDKVTTVILSFLDNAHPTMVREMLTILDKARLWSSLSASDNQTVLANLRRVLANANPGYRKEIEALLLESGLLVN